MISDAWIQLISPLIARNITSCNLMARSNADGAYSTIDTSLN